jgi:C4-dicarboxylate-specific signal transduction histidine kinase
MGMASSAWRHGIVKHALTIQEQSQLLREDIVQVPSQDRHLQAEERLHMIEQLTRQILEKPITPPLSAEEGASSVSINGLIRERTKQLWQSEPYRSVELDLDLHLDDQATVRASSEWLRRALDVLVDNAVEAVADCAPKRITVVTQQKDKQAEILVSDTGTGIPEEDLAVLLWEPIRKLKGAQGLGMGLLMAQAIVQTYGGDIEVGATGPTGTTMCIMLPLETSTA